MSTRQPIKFGRVQTLLASAARTDATGSGDAVYLPVCQSITFELDVTAAATDAGDLLDVYVQTSIDGTNYVDIQRFTQVAGNGGAKRFYTKVCAGTATTEFENGTGLSAAALRHTMGDFYRARWAITDAGTDNASFTFSVWACPVG